MGDQPIAKPLPTNRIPQTQSKRTQTSLPPVGFELTISVLERAKTVHVLDRATTLKVLTFLHSLVILSLLNNALTYLLP
jgi:hypothetical protein